MTFNELFKTIKRKINDHPEIILDCEKLAIQITNIADQDSFYILWSNDRCFVEPFPYNDYDVCITASQHDIELLFTERQYLFMTYQQFNIKGSFVDVMAFQKLLSYITGDNSYTVQEDIISRMMLKQDMLQKDLEIIMESMQLLVTNSLINNMSAVPSEKSKKKKQIP